MTDLSPRVKVCVGCGWCCTKAPCGLVFRHYPEWKSPCPALVERNGLKRCKIILDAEGQQRRDLMEELAIGAGCCAALFNTAREAQIRRLYGHSAGAPARRR